MTGVVHFLAADINVGTHVQRGRPRPRHHLGDRGRHGDRRRAWACTCGPGPPAGCPGKLQLVWEMGVAGRRASRCEGSIGPRGHGRRPPGGGAVRLHPGGQLVLGRWASARRSSGSGRPTGDINMTLALALDRDHPRAHRLDPQSGFGRLRQALREPALPQGPLPRQRLHQRRRGDRQAPHPGAPTLRQPAVGRPHAGPHRRAGGLDHLARAHRRRRSRSILNPCGSSSTSPSAPSRPSSSPCSRSSTSTPP